MEKAIFSKVEANNYMVKSRNCWNFLMAAVKSTHGRLTQISLERQITDLEGLNRLYFILEAIEKCRKTSLTAV